MCRWLGEGRLVYREDVARGIEATPAAFCRLFAGENFGKALVQLCDDPSKA
jgi:NADPH-dependent curcumin reductase CurA